MIADGDAPLVGRRLGVYQVQAALGAGGMGEVYRARDTRLGRDVAIKVLPPAFTSDPDRLARFEREARVLASLNHPHVAAIHGIEESDGITALVLELVEGETLAERIARSGAPKGAPLRTLGRSAGSSDPAIPIGEALTIARQIADALEAAHDKGIVHRDLKPANIKITPDGVMKVLDFGLAKVVAGDGSGADLSHAPTVTVGGTREGLIVGTAAYMSPEQARGQAVDKRTDIWAFGCVLYEMLTGRGAFAGDDVSDTVARVLMKEPDWEALPPTTPPAIRKLLQRCLAKDRLRRLSDAAHARLEIEEALALPSAEAFEPLSAGSIPKRRVAVLIGSACVTAALVAVTTVWWVSRSAGPPGIDGPNVPGPVTHTTIELPASAPLVALGIQIPANGWNRPVVALSPDGAHLAYVAWSGADTMLHVRDLSSTQIRPVAGSEGAIFAFFSPDSQWLGFLTNDKVKKISLNGGTVITVCDARNPVQAWWRNSAIFFDQDEGGLLSSVSAEGGRPTDVLSIGDINQFAPVAGFRRFSDVLPDGQMVLATFWSHGRSGDYGEIELVSLEKKQIRLLIRSGYGARYVAPGRLVFARAGSILGVRFDLERGEVQGQPVPIVTGASMESIWGLVHTAVSNSGLLAYVPGRDLSVGQLAWVTRSGATEFLDVPERVYTAVRLAPSGTRLAASIADTTDYIWTYDLDRREGRRLSGTENADTFAWSPDSLRLAFGVVAPGAPMRAFIRSADGGAPAAAVSAPNAVTGVIRWSPQGSTLGLSYRGGMVRFLSFDGKEERAAWRTPINNLWDFSPDGRWLAYSSAETGQFEIWVRSYQDDAVIRQVSVDGGVEPVWCRCGELFYRRGNRWFSSTIATSPELRWEPPRAVFATEFVDSVGTSYDVSSDGQRLLVAKRTEPHDQRRLHIVTNWFAALAEAP